MIECTYEVEEQTVGSGRPRYFIVRRWTFMSIQIWESVSLLPDL